MTADSRPLRSGASAVNSGLRDLRRSRVRCAYRAGSEGSQVYRFKLGPAGKTRRLTELRGAHLVGADSVPVRGDLTLENGEVRCSCRTGDPTGVSLLWPVGDFGSVQLETTRLPQRDAAYQLSLELARHRLMRINLKREEWGLFDYPGMDDLAEQIETARQLFVKSLQHLDNPDAASELADQALSQAMWASESMCRFHASVFLARRQQSGGFNKHFLGVSLPPGPPQASITRVIREAFDFVRLPLIWRQIQPTEQTTTFDAPDGWLGIFKGTPLGVVGGPLLNFGVQFVPDWMYIWENDFETIFEYAREHVRRTVLRYAGQASMWIAASGLHADNALSFSFEQIMELTRMACTITRGANARTPVLIELTQPWGEYYARNQQTIPPLQYADMCVQGGIPFDAFGLQFVFGIDSDGYRLRDMLQISALIDKLANLGKPLHITAVAVPSGKSAGRAGGKWHADWSEDAQALWLESFCEVALSKPYVESVCLQSLADTPECPVPLSGVLREDLGKKSAFLRLEQFRRRLLTPPPPAKK